MNDLIFEKKFFFSRVGYLLNYPLASYLGNTANTTKAGFLGFGCCGQSTASASGQGMFFLDIWVAI
jgi:hypothetical protein